MLNEPVSDHLELWRGIDDAVWREAARVAPFAMSRKLPPALVPEPRAAEPKLSKIPEPA